MKSSQRVSCIIILPSLAGPFLSSGGPGTLNPAFISCYAFDPTTNSWQANAARPSENRDKGTATAHPTIPGALIVSGGYKSSGAVEVIYNNLTVESGIGVAPNVLSWVVRHCQVEN